jgi:hypothetical protein
MLTVLANYNVTVEELKAIFYRLKGENQTWVQISSYNKDKIYS